MAQTNSNNFFSSGNRVRNGQYIKYGDYIFFYGLKIIFIGAEIVTCAPPNSVKVNPRLISAPHRNHFTIPEIDVQDIVDDPLYSESDYYQKSPRLNYITYQADISIDNPPAPEGRNQLPDILMIAPRITMGLTSVLSMGSTLYFMFSSNRNQIMMTISLFTMTLTLVGTLLWPNITQFYNKYRIKKRETRRLTRYRKYLQHKQENLKLICDNQRNTLLQNNPSPAECLDIVKNRKLSLWQRSISHYDFLHVRVGLGEVRTNINLKEPEERFTLEDEDILESEYKQVIKDALALKDAPVEYRLITQQIGAIVGPNQLTKSFLDCLFLQILTLHSYSDLKVVVYTKSPEKWDFLKTVPHCWSNDKSHRYFATSVESFSSFSGEIEHIFDARVKNDDEADTDALNMNSGSEKSFRDFHPYYLFFIDNIEDLRNNSLIQKILHIKRNLGFSILTYTTSISLLPAETTNFVSISSDKCVIIWGDSSTKELEFTADFNNDQIDMQYFASLLANIPVQIEKGRFELPKSLPFLEMYRCGRVEQLNSLARWKNNLPYNSLAAPVGIDQNNELFTMDIHEKAYGPHGLIAGTTGSGKSEWIITFILSLAVNYSPDELQFVLIDYKGGGLAKSFENKELKIKLPHLAGTITNLDKSEIFRSISAIESELKRRQAAFNAAREKLKEGSMDIYKYQQYYRKGLVDEPMSHLIIICDEFAELKQQEPEFMEQLISTSRIGRSLGVHLILATQKPSGVVNDQIWSNSKFKIALKVQTRSDSSEILKRPDAAYLKQTGAFYLQVGVDEYFNLGQSAWAGAKYYPSDTATHKIDETVQRINEIGQVIETYEDENDREEIQAQGEQLINIVQYLSHIGEQTPLVKRQLWLENIPSLIYYDDIRAKYNLPKPPKFTYNTLVGEFDEPRAQMQGPMHINLTDGNIAIMGRPDGSVEKLISTIVWSNVCTHTPAEIAFYIIDFGSETMKKFAAFPHVGEVIFQDETDKVAGVLGIILEEMHRRKELLAEYNGSFDYYNRVAQEKLSLITVIINGYDSFVDLLPRVQKTVEDMFRDCPKYGIIFILGSNNKNAVSYRLQQYFSHLILMQLVDNTDYRAITGCRRGLVPRRAVGRGICKLSYENVGSYCEFQTASIATETKEIETIKDFASKCIEYYKCKVQQLAKIPEDISSADVASYATSRADTPIGIDMYGKQLSRYDFEQQKIHIITGASIKQNVNFLYALATVLSKTPNTKVRVVDLLDIFKKPILDVQFFQSSKDIVFASLFNDAKTRTEDRDMGVTFIIGIGRYRNYLSRAGSIIFNDFMKSIPDSKRNIYILIDDYDSMRTLMMEEWFSNINTENGIWLGPGLDQQSLFSTNEPSDGDKNLNYTGLSFVIKDNEYTVTKLIVDGEK